MSWTAAEVRDEGAASTVGGSEIMLSESVLADASESITRGETEGGCASGL